MADSRSNVPLANRSGIGQIAADGTVLVEEKDEHLVDGRSSGATPSSPANDGLNTATYDYLDKPIRSPPSGLHPYTGEDSADVERGQINVLNLEMAHGAHTADLKEIPTFRARGGHQRGASQVPLAMSTLEGEIKRREKSIQFQRFMRDRDSRIVPRLNPLMAKMILRQPKPMALKRGNLLETFGCHPGPGIRENAKFMMQSV